MKGGGVKGRLELFQKLIRFGSVTFGHITSLLESACELNVFQINVFKTWGEKGLNFLDKICQHFDHFCSISIIPLSSSFSYSHSSSSSSSWSSLRAVSNHLSGDPNISWAALQPHIRLAGRRSETKYWKYLNHWKYWKYWKYWILPCPETALSGKILKRKFTQIALPPHFEKRKDITANQKLFWIENVRNQQSSSWLTLSFSLLNPISHILSVFTTMMIV